MIPDKQIKDIREELEYCKRPLFFFHDDPDGLCSFLLLYRFIGEGKGIVVKSSPKIDINFLPKVEEYQPDKIFILDLALVNQDFLDAVNVPVIWIDHHDPMHRDKVKYYNPRIEDQKDNTPVSYYCYKVTQKENDLWIAICGIVGDWFMLPLSKEFSKRYPSLLPEKITEPEKVLFDTKLGELIKILSFVMKGTTSEVMKCIKIMTRIEDPNEILEQTTPRGNYIYKRAMLVKKEYDIIFEDAMKVKKDSIVEYQYSGGKYSFTKELSNELLFQNPDKVILVCREKSGEMKCSLRSGHSVILPPILERALKDIDGYGGGHEHACGACVKKEDFQQFMQNLREELKNADKKN
jgi:nanoRNase/pAp phosphatase (c-di-AMP/oligoRNAs hydrolase)